MPKWEAKTQEAKDLYAKLKEIVEKEKPKSKLQKAKRLVAEFELGVGNEDMFIATAHVFFGNKK